MITLVRRDQLSASENQPTPDSEWSVSPVGKRKPAKRSQDQPTPDSEWSVSPNQGFDSGKPTWWTRRGLQMLALLLFLAGCTAAGSTIGWWVRDSRSQTTAPITIHAVVERPAVLTGSPIGEIPSVVGLRLEQAQQTLFNAGVSPGMIVLNEQPTDQENALVVAQQPSAGAAIPNRVTLTVSV